MYISVHLLNITKDNNLMNMKLKTIIGKDCDISLLKGVKYKDFTNQVQIAKTVERFF